MGDIWGHLGTFGDSWGTVGGQLGDSSEQKCRTVPTEVQNCPHRSAELSPLEGDTICCLIHISEKVNSRAVDSESFIRSAIKEFCERNNKIPPGENPYNVFNKNISIYEGYSVAICSDTDFDTIEISR